MFDESMISFLEAGRSLLIGTVDVEGRPLASRGWGLEVVDGEAGVLRALVEADDADTLANLEPARRVAITSTDVATLRSYQFKGRVVFVEAPSADDESRRARYTGEFLEAVHRADRNPIEQLERWARTRVMACVMQVDEWFDQTPGPLAGAPVGARSAMGGAL